MAHLDVLSIELTSADLDRFHGTDERVTQGAYANASRFYRQLILNSTP